MTAGAVNSAGGAGAGELFSLYRDGRHADVIERARALLSSGPADAAVHGLLASSCLALGQYDAAVASCKAALSLRPDLEKVHNTLGVACLRLGRPAEAAASFHSAVNANPGFAPGWFNLGMVLEHLERRREAADCYRKTIELEPQHADALTALGSLCWELGDHAAAGEYLDRAVAADGSHVRAHANLLNFLEKSNRHRDVCSALERARKMLGGHPVVRLYEGILADIDGDARGAQSILESIEPEGWPAPAEELERRRLARLAAICDRLNRTGSAMEYAQAANRLSARICRQRNIDAGEVVRFIENRRAFFGSTDTAAWTAAPRLHGMPSPAFVVGFPRSGTTLLDAMLRGHPLVRIAEESGAVPAMVNALSGAADEHLSSLPGLSAAGARRLREIYFTTLQQQVGEISPEARLVDRFAMNIIYAGEIHRVFPDARFILMLRHPADAVLGCFMQTFHETSASANFHTLEDAAALYRRVFELWELYERLPGMQVLAIRYEGLVRDPERSCRVILDFLGLPWDPAVLSPDETARRRPLIRTASYNQVIRPLYTEPATRRHRYRNHLAPVLPSLNPWIEKFGYE